MLPAEMIPRGRRMSALFMAAKRQEYGVPHLASSYLP